jgi:autotransporter-associated beta strand protein
MRRRWSFLAVTTTLLAVSAPLALASSGIFNSFVVVDKGTGNVFYDLASSTGNPDWQGQNLGSFFAGGSSDGGAVLTLNGGELQTFQNSGDDIQHAYVNYRLTGASGFTEFEIFFNSEWPSFGNNPGDKKWQTTGQNIKVLNGLAPGTYNFDVYGRAHGVNNGFHFDLFANNGGNNYTATFVVNVSNFTWDGGGANGNTSTGQNWSNDVAPGNGHNLTFAGTTNRNVNNMLSSANSLRFASGAGAYTIAGNDLSISAGVTNLSGSLQTINTNLLLLANQTFDAGSSSGGELAFGGAINSNGKTLTVTGADNATISGAISGSGALNKQGAGALTLAPSVTHTYGGATSVTGGTLIVRGTLGSSINAVTIASSAVLAGSGSVQRPIVIQSGGSIFPGTSATTAQFTAADNFTLSSGAILRVELDGDGAGGIGVAGADYDQVLMTGSGKTFVIGGATLQVVPLSRAVVGQAYRIVSATGGSAVNFVSFFAGLNNGDEYDAGGGVRYRVDADASGIDVTFTSVPEPSSLGLVVVLCGALMGLRRRPVPC